MVQPKAFENDEPAIDFFQVIYIYHHHDQHDSNYILTRIRGGFVVVLKDMTPQVIKQKKLFIATNKNEPENFSRLQATTAAHIPHIQSSELEDLSDENDDDNDQSGWDVNDNDDLAKQIIREKRREARAQRNQRIQQQKQQQQQQMHSGPYAHR